MSAKKGLRSMTRADQAFTVCNYIFLTLILVLVAYPCIYVISCSFSDSYAVVSGQVWLWPVNPTLKGYITTLKDPTLIRGFLNALYITVVGTAINIVVTLLMAYPLSRKNFYGRNVVTALITVTMFFGGGLVPTFLLINQLGLYNTFWALMLPGAVGVTNVIIARTYFQSSIPEELYEAGQLDGCDDFHYLLKVVIPLSAPVIAVLVMYYAVGHWNAYFNAMIYLKDKEKFPLQVVLRSILVKNTMTDDMMMDAEAFQRTQGLAELLKYSTIVVSSLPMMILYPFIQKHFVKGVMIGAIKG